MKLIPLTQGQFAKVDDKDYEELSKYKWYAHWKSDTRSFSAWRGHYTGGNNKTILMHRVIMGAKQGEQVDHRNHDTLDNRRENLRICTNAENHANVRHKIGGSSVYKGCHWDKERKKWQAHIKRDGHIYHLGRFLDERDAAIAYDAKARELFGEFALTNFSQGEMA
jgi:hypothetical protein